MLGSGVAVELLFRRHFWIVHLLFIFAVALLLARIGNAFIEGLVTPLPTGAPRAKAAAARYDPVATLSMEKVAKLTGLKVPEPEPDVKEPSTPVVDLAAAPVRSGLRVKLLGTLMSAVPEWSIATIQDVVTLKAETYMVGDDLQTAKVLEIERERVIVLNNNRREFIDNTAGDGTGAPPPVVAMVATPVNNAPPPSTALGAGVKQVSENEYEIPRNEIDKTLSNLNDVAMQARIVPAFKDGQAQGFKLFSIRPDSIYTKIGVQNGDVIKRINGYDLNSPEKALEIYTKLKEASRIDIEIERNGANVRKTYSIR